MLVSGHRIRVHDMFCHAVYGATHAINQRYAPLLEPLGLTYPQYITLLILGEQDGVGVGTLADELKMKTSTMTPLLKRLEMSGHVERRRLVEDQRKVKVFLTDSGREVLQKAPAITECMIGNTQFSEERLRELVELLHSLTDNLRNPR